MLFVLLSRSFLLVQLVDHALTSRTLLDQLMEHRESGRQVRHQGLAGAGQMFAVKQHEGASHPHLASKAQHVLVTCVAIFLQGCSFALVDQYNTRSVQGIGTNSSLLPCQTFSCLLKMCPGRHNQTPLKIRYN